MELAPCALLVVRQNARGGILQQWTLFVAFGGQFVHSTCTAWHQGQFVLQPTFAKSDKKFSTRDVLRAASVAADRSGNERAIRISKISAYVKRGTQKHTNIVRLCAAWLAWSFQANFMFEPIL